MTTIIHEAGSNWSIILAVLRKYHPASTKIDYNGIATPDIRPPPRRWSFWAQRFCFSSRALLAGSTAKSASRSPAGHQTRY
jgi:hypothetical protein